MCGLAEPESSEIRSTLCDGAPDVFRRILATVRKLNIAQVFGGKQVDNLAPTGAPNKGDALVAAREPGCNRVLHE